MLRSTGPLNKRKLLLLCVTPKNPPILTNYDPGKPVEMHTDASGVSSGVVVMQKHPEERNVAYGSRSLSKTERNYFTTAPECLATHGACIKT